MLEDVLAVGSDASWLPTAEGRQGTGVLCSSGGLIAIRRTTAYRYLPFAKNGINFVCPNGLDVISFNFTGCIMAAFKHVDGTMKVCHVSTGPGQDCKDEWQRVKTVSTNVFAFRPSDFIETNGQALWGCYGLITADLQTYAITVVRAHDGTRSVAAIKKAHLLRGE